MLAGKHLASSSESSLYLFGNENNTVFLADALERWQVFVRWHNNTRVSLNRLDEQTSHFVWWEHGGE